MQPHPGTRTRKPNPGSSQPRPSFLEHTHCIAVHEHTHHTAPCLAHNPVESKHPTRLAAHAARAQSRPLSMIALSPCSTPSWASLSSSISLSCAPSSPLALNTSTYRPSPRHPSASHTSSRLISRKEVSRREGAGAGNSSESPASALPAPFDADATSRSAPPWRSSSRWSIWTCCTSLRRRLISFAVLPAELLVEEAGPHAPLPASLFEEGGPIPGELSSVCSSSRLCISSISASPWSSCTATLRSARNISVDWSADRPTSTEALLAPWM
mmetsp:Transcript_40587/g.83013  ORF Transcript_40587/g.83013 Transcript_40587/m.83013 type:complete len:270 (+) Transcript_40587:70-879(+)